MKIDELIEILAPSEAATARIRDLAAIASLRPHPRGCQAVALANGTTRIVRDAEIGPARMRYHAYVTKAEIAQGRKLSASARLRLL